MKITVKTVLITCVILLLAIFGGVGAVMMTYLLPKIQQMHQPVVQTPLASQLAVPGMENAGPPILKVQTTDSLAKTAEEMEMPR